jgi:exopolysaccharide production protein ExoZ
MLYNLQCLRFFSAAAVALFHILGKNHTDIQFPIGQVGVDIFFVISGFIMVFITEKREQSGGDFFLHRLTRVAPPYWFVTLILATGLFFIPSAFSESVFSWPQLVTSLLFWPYPHYPISDEAYPLYSPGWTLNYEFFFYTIFAVAMAISWKWRV